MAPPVLREGYFAVPTDALKSKSAWVFAAILAVSAGAVSNPDKGWPEFRGPWSNGHVAAPGDTTPVGLPLRWSETENIVWKTEIPKYGWSTPVILGHDIWLTTATEDGHDFFAICVEADTGKVRIDKKLFHCDNPEPLNNAVNCYASPSPVIEPGRVYVHFGSYGTACLDTATGETIWKREDLKCRHFRGPGSSLILYKDLLILTFDGVDVQYVTALDKKTGEDVWKTDRTTQWNDLDAEGKPVREGDFRKGYSTPLIIETGGKTQMISPGSACAFSYDPLTGKELWHTRFDGYTPAARPVFGNGLVYIVSGRGKARLAAMRVDGTGDVTDSHQAWKFEGPELPTEPSPILVDDLLYLLNNSGTVTCLDAKSGKMVWSERIGGNYVASPIYADGRLYFSSTQGKTHILKAGKTFEVLATNELADGFMASPAVMGNALILRTKTHLYRIEGAASKSN